MGVGWGGRWFVGCHGGVVENEERKLKGGKEEGEGSMREEEKNFLRWPGLGRGHRL